LDARVVAFEVSGVLRGCDVHIIHTYNSASAVMYFSVKVVIPPVSSHH
jgi:hypothetical protein